MSSRRGIGKLRPSAVLELMRARKLISRPGEAAARLLVLSVELVRRHQRALWCRLCTLCTWLTGNPAANLKLDVPSDGFFQPRGACARALPNRSYLAGMAGAGFVVSSRSLPG